MDPKLFDILWEVYRKAGAPDAEAAVVAELLAVVADKVEDGADGLALGLPEPATELLEEQQRALGRSQHQERIHGRHVHAFIEQVDRKD